MEFFAPRWTGKCVLEPFVLFPSHGGHRLEVSSKVESSASLESAETVRRRRRRSDGVDLVVWFVPFTGDGRGFGRERLIVSWWFVLSINLKHRSQGLCRLNGTEDTTLANAKTAKPASDPIPE
jgi:hypothetical protein